MTELQNVTSGSSFMTSAFEGNQMDEDKKTKMRPEGRKLLGVHLSREAIRQFNTLAAERGLQKQELMSEALNDLFEKYKKPPIA